MKTLKFEIPIYKINVRLVQVEGKDDLDDVMLLLDGNGIKDVGDVETYIKEERQNGGNSFRYLDKRKIVAVFYPFSSNNEMENVYSHEKRHIEDRVLNYFGVNDIESAAMLAGFLGEKFYEFKNV